MAKLTNLGCGLSVLWILVWVYGIASYIWNIVKLTQCDFAGPVWKEEILHLLGLIPPINMVVCWF